MSKILILNRESFRNDVALQDWTCNGSDAPNVLWADWKTKFLDIVNIHAPLRTRRARTKKAPWINSEFMKGMRERNDAKRKAMASNDARDWEKYKKLRKTIKEITSKLLKHLIILTLLFNLKVILEKHGKQLTSLLPVPSTIQRCHGEALLREI